MLLFCPQKFSSFKRRYISEIHTNTTFCWTPTKKAKLKCSRLKCSWNIFCALHDNRCLLQSFFHFVWCFASFCLFSFINISGKYQHCLLLQIPSVFFQFGKYILQRSTLFDTFLKLTKTKSIKSNKQSGPLQDLLLKLKRQKASKQQT